MAFPTRVDFQWRVLDERRSSKEWTSSRAIARRLSNLGGSSAVNQAIELSRSIKPPPGYDEHYGEMSQLYDGNQLEATRLDLARRFAHSARFMEPVALPIVGHHAHNAAQVYREPATRWIEVDGVRPGSTEVDDDGELVVRGVGDLDRQTAFQDLLEQARVHSVLQEAEKVVRGLHTVFIFARWDDDGAAVGRRPRMRLSIWRPHQVQVLPHPDMPGDLWASWAVLLRISRPGADGGEWFKVWSRREELGEWWVSEQSTEGHALGQPRPYGSHHLPGVVMHDGITDGIFLDRDRLMRDAQHGVNALLTDWVYGAKMQAHGERWIAGKDADRLKGAKIAVGPGKLHTFPEGTQAGVFSFGFDKTTLEGAEQILKAIGFTTRQDPDSWSTKPGNPPTGVSRDIAKAPAYERRDEDVALAMSWESTEFLPMLARVADRFGDFGAQIHGDDVTYHVAIPPPKRFTDPRSQAELAKLAEDQDWISAAEAAVRAGLYRSVEEAAGAGLATQRRAQIAEAAAAAGDDVQKLALNGAQVTALQGLVAAASRGEIPVSAARGVILGSFPLPPEDVDAILADVSPAGPSVEGGEPAVDGGGPPADEEPADT